MYRTTGNESQATMSQKIDGTTPRSPLGGPAPVPPRADVPVRPAPASGDTVELTDSARLLQRLETMLANAPMTDRVRVEAVRQALANGAYEIDPQRIAAQVLRLERDLLGRR